MSKGKNTNKNANANKKPPLNVENNKGLDDTEPKTADNAGKDTSPSKEEKLVKAWRGNDNYAQDKSIELDEKKEEQKAKKFLKAGFFSKMPSWLRSVLIKFWFSAAVFFFIGFGTVSIARDNYNLIAAIGLVIGLMTDFIITPFLKMCDGVKEDAYKFNLFDIKTKKLRVLNTLFNLLYAVIISFLVALIYVGINTAINASKGYGTDAVTFLAEPFLFGLFYVAIDMCVLLVRNLVVGIINRVKNK